MGEAPNPGGYVAPSPFAAPSQRAQPLAGPPQLPVPMSLEHRQRARRRIWAAAVLVVAVLALATSLVVSRTVRPSSAGRHLVLPAGADGYHQRVDQETSYLADTLRARARSLSGYAPSTFDGALVGVYSKHRSDVPDVLFIGIGRNTNAATKHVFGSGTPARVVAGLASSAGLVDAHAYPGATLVGALSCGRTADPTLELCVWSDSSTMGLVLDVRASLPESGLARLTADLRAAAER